MNSSEGCGRGAVFHDFRTGVEIDSQVAHGFSGIFCGFHTTERGIDFHVVAVLMDVGVVRDAPGEKCGGRCAEDSQKDDDRYYDQNDFERAVICGRGCGCGNGSRRWRRSRSGTGKWGSEYGSAAFVTEAGSGVERCATGIAESHGLPRSLRKLGMAGV